VEGVRRKGEADGVELRKRQAARQGSGADRCRSCAALACWWAPAGRAPHAEESCAEDHCVRARRTDGMGWDSLFPLSNLSLDTEAPRDTRHCPRERDGANAQQRRGTALARGASRRHWVRRERAGALTVWGGVRGLHAAPPPHPRCPFDFSQSFSLRF